MLLINPHFLHPHKTMVPNGPKNGPNSPKKLQVNEPPVLAMGVQPQHSGANGTCGCWVICFQEPLEQLSMQQELAKGNVWGRKP